MTIVEATAQFVSGCQNIERAIKAGLASRAKTVPSQDIHWSKPIVPPQRTGISVEVTVAGQRASATFSYEEVSDSWKHIERPDVAAKIRAVVAQFSGEAQSDAR